MERRISSLWVLIGACVLVPLASGVNALVLPRLLGCVTAGGGAPLTQLGTWSSMELAFSSPLGLLTLALIRHWNGGHFAQTRLYCCAVAGVAALGWHYYGATVHLGSAESASIGALLLLPFIWTLLFPVFALCAREPKVW